MRNIPLKTIFKSSSNLLLGKHLESTLVAPNLGMVLLNFLMLFASGFQVIMKKISFEKKKPNQAKIGRKMEEKVKKP